MTFKQFKFTSRQLLSAFFIYALVFTPLLSTDGVIQEARGQIIIEFCEQTYATRIFQFCPLDSPVETALTNQAIDDVLALYELPASDRPLLLKHARNEVRAQLYVRFLQIINKQNPTADEQRAIAAFARRIKDKRIESAQKAKAEYDRFQSTNCRIYHPPSPYTYNAGYGCYSPLANFFSSSSPSFEEFQNFGAALAYEDSATPEAQAVTTQTTQGIVAGTGIAAAGIGAAAAAAIGSTITFGTLSAIIPFAGLSFTTVSAATASGTLVVATLPAAGAASGTIGASAAAGPAAIIILAVAAAVMEGINVANQRELPGKLDQAIIDKQNETVDVRALVNGDDAQKQEVYGAFIRITLPEFPDNEAITPSQSDPIFTVSTPATAATDANSMNYTPWGGQSTTENNEARLSGRSWFLVRNSSSSQTTYRKRLTINYQGENGEPLTARRRGREFVVTSPGNPSATVVTDTLKTRVNNTVHSYKVKPNAALLAVAGNSLLNVGCGFREFNPDTNESFFPVFLGRILDTGGTPINQLTLAVNNGAQATVNNITLKNPSVRTIDGTNYITAQAIPDAAAFGDSANFTIKVTNNFEDTQFATTIKKTAILDSLPNKLPANLTVGTNYSFSLNTSGGITSFGQCPGFSYSISGELPAGLTFVNNHPDGGPENPGEVSLVGTAASDGDYKFTVNKNYTNGEVLSRSYRIGIRGNIAEIPGGVKSWWRAENNAEDFTNRAGGTMVGAATFINGKVSRGFYFRGANGYIGLPNNAFQIASGSQTFETWFKTGTKGVILGRQSSNVTPYNAPVAGGTNPLIYVDQNGKLRVGFGNRESIATSQNRVDNNAYHHVAVTFSEAGGGAVYLDGVSIGANNGRAATGANQKFQFGTGYVNDQFSSGMTGWFNFNGTIDEPAIYDQILSPVQIKAIYAAGAGGKISVNAVSTPPTQRDGNNGTITINAQGGVRQLSYSITNGATFQTTNFFQNLTPGTYQTVVRDGGDRDVRRTVTITNPAPNLSFTTQITTPQCFGGNANITIFPSGGSSNNYEYSVRNGANIQTSNVFTDIGAGNYIPWIRDIASNTTYANGTINIAQPTQIAVSPASFLNAALNQPYSQTFTVSGGTPGYSIAVSGDVQTNFQLPAGLTQTVSGNTVTISGTPTQTGNFNTFFEIYDQNSCRQGAFVPFVITSNQTYGIAGRATNGGQALANVTITLTGAENRSTITDANGNYSFATVAGGANYTVTATLNDATFAQPAIALNNLSANLTDTDFVLSPTTYEGDFAPRRSGDGAVNVLDLVALGRTLMPNNPDARPANGAEFQRADSDPRSNLGNGIINTNDLTQIRNYILGTSQKVPAGGAIAPAPPAADQAQTDEDSFFKTPELDLPNLKVDFSNADAATGTATVSADTITYSGGGSAVVPIRMTTSGGVQAAQFTISYDATRLSPSLIVNQAPANTEVIATPNGVGKITVVVNQPIDGSSVFPTGTFDLLRINFAPVQNVPSGFGRIDFTDTPTTRIASDPQANAVTLSANPGGVSFSADSISGKVMNGGQGLSNVTVHLETLGRTSVTDASGNYFFGNLTPGANYTIRAELNGYTFSPATLAFNNFNANISNADFNTTQTSYEGDIAGRPTGNGAVNTLDIESLGSIIARREAQPVSGGEWQRSDVAPAASYGDGAVNVRDLVQLGRYVSSGSLIPASGAINAAQPPASLTTEEESLSEITDVSSFAQNLFDNSEDGKSLNSFDRLLDNQTSESAEASAVGTATVSASSVSATNASASVPIRLDSSGDTAAIQFTVNYDPAKLSIPNEAAIVSRQPNTTFVFNTATAGKLGVVAYRPLDGTSVFQIGDIALFNINFTVAGNAGGSTSVGFGSVPVVQTAANPQAEAGQLLGTPGTVSMLAPTAANVTLGGRVLVGERGLANASVKLVSQTGVSRLARTNAFGFYRFAEVAAGETCVITVDSKNYSFNPLVTVVLEDTGNLNFAALQ